MVTHPTAKKLLEDKVLCPFEAEHLSHLLWKKESLDAIITKILRKQSTTA